MASTPWEVGTSHGKCRSRPAVDSSGQPAMLGWVTEMRRWLITPATVVALLVGGCSGGDDDSAPEPSDRAGAPTLHQRPAELEVAIARLHGRLPKPAVRRLTQRLGHAVATWINGAFLPGDYPRTSFAGYASFTPDAARLARRSDGVTSNVRLGRQWVQVVPTRRSVRLHVFAPGHRPSGATARVVLVLAGVGRAGEVSELAVTGDLYLTWTGSGWRIFGFDLSRSVGKPGSYAARQSAERDEKTGKPDRKPQKRHAQRRKGAR
jgi:hypothetical protein